MISGSFFIFLWKNNPVYKNYTMDQFQVQDLERLEPVDIEEYMEYLKVYQHNEELLTNGGKRPVPQDVGAAKLLQLLLQAPGDHQESHLAGSYAKAS